MNRFRDVGDLHVVDAFAGLTEPDRNDVNHRPHLRSVGVDVLPHLAVGRDLARFESNFQRRVRCQDIRVAELGPPVTNDVGDADTEHVGERLVGSKDLAIRVDQLEPVSGCVETALEQDRSTPRVIEFLGGDTQANQLLSNRRQRGKPTRLLRTDGPRLAIDDAERAER